MKYDVIARRLLELCPVGSGSAAEWYLRNRGILDEARAEGLGALPRTTYGREDLVSQLLSEFERDDLEAAGILREASNTLEWPESELLIPWRSTEGRITCVQRRRLDQGDPRYVCPPHRSPREPFGIQALNELALDVPVAIVEGALDTLACRRIATLHEERVAVIGIYSASTASRGLLPRMRRRVVVVAVDTDDAGERAAQLLMALLTPIAAVVSRLELVDDKDWGDALVRFLRGK